MHNSMCLLITYSKDQFRNLGHASTEVLIGNTFNKINNNCIEEDDFLINTAGLGGDSSPPPTKKQTKLYVKDSISFSKKLKCWQMNWPAGQRAQVRGRGRSKINTTKNRGMNENILKKN